MNSRIATTLSFCAFTAVAALGQPAPVVAPTRSPTLTEQSVAVKVGYDSNVFATDNERPGTELADQASSFITVTPKLALNLATLLGGSASPWKTATLSYTGDYTFYADNTSENHGIHRLAAAGKFQSGPTTLTLDNTFTWVDGSKLAPRYQRNSAYGSAVPRERREQFQDRAKLALRYDISSAFWARVVGQMLWYDLQTEQHEAVGAYAGWQNWVDRYDINAGIDLGWNVSKGWALVGSWRHGFQFQDHFAWTAVNNSNHYHRFLAGVEGTLLPGLKVELSAGPDFRLHGISSRGVADHSYTRLFLDATASYQLGKDDQISAVARQWHWVSSTGMTAYEDRTHSLTWKHQWSAEWSSSLGYQRQQSDYVLPADRDDVVHALIVSARWQVSKSLELSADYLFQRAENEVPRVSADGREFSRHLGSITVKGLF